MALFMATREALYFRQLMEDLGYPQPHQTPVLVDSESAKFTANSEVVTSAHRHIDVRMFRIRDHIRLGDISVQHIYGVHNPADLFTKVLSAPIHAEHVGHISSGFPYSTPITRRVRGGAGTKSVNNAPRSVYRSGGARSPGSERSVAVNLAD